MAKKRVTIEEIAEAAGVSKTTVSRYLNGMTHLMSEATAKKIQNIIELCDYHPSVYARALKNNKTKMIGIIVSDIFSPWSSAFIGECERELSAHGYMASFFNSNGCIEKEKELVASLDNRSVEGLIVNPASPSDPYLMNYALSGMPVVVCDRLIQGYPFNAVIAEIRKPIRNMVAHLKEQGFTRPILFSLTKGESYARKLRIQAFREAMLEEYGYFHEADVFHIENDNAEAVFARLKQFMEKKPPKDRVAVVCVNTITTLRVFSSIQRLNLSIPDDIGICGQDDWCWDDSIRLPSILYPEVTTVNIDSKEIGRQCAKMILRKISDGNTAADCEVIEVPCSLSIRASTLLKKCSQ